MEQITELRERIRVLEEENARLRTGSRSQIPSKESSDSSNPNESQSSFTTSFQGVLAPEEIERYSRQLLLHGGFGVEGQRKMLKSSVLIVGAGGIGSTGKVSEVGIFS